MEYRPPIEPTPQDSWGNPEPAKPDDEPVAAPMDGANEPKPVTEHSAHDGWGDVKAISFCPQCGAQFSPKDAKVVREKEYSYLLHILCDGCGCAILSTVLISERGIDAIGLVTDLEIQEVMPRYRAPAVSADDVIDLHHALEDEEGFWGMIGRRWRKIRVQEEAEPPRSGGGADDAGLVGGNAGVA